MKGELVKEQRMVGWEGGINMYEKKHCSYSVKQEGKKKNEIGITVIPRVITHLQQARAGNHNHPPDLASSPAPMLMMVMELVFH